MTAVFCLDTADRAAETGRGRREPFAPLEFAVSDAAAGIAAAVAPVAAARRDDPAAAPLEHGRDAFPTAHEAHRVLAGHRRRAAAAWERAEAADAQGERARQHGVEGRGPAGPARAAWAKARAAFAAAERLEAAWRRAPAALDLFGPDGRLNDRTRAPAGIAAAPEDLTGPAWSKVRPFLTDRRSPAFLDRRHRRWESAEPRPEWREAMAWRWWLRHRRTGPSDPLTDLRRGVARDRGWDGEERARSERVAAVLGATARASRAVECLNSARRMQQSRHRRMTPPLPDLKRRYGNTRALRSGPRKDRGPYQALGLGLPTSDFWEVLQSDPGRSAQDRSTSQNAE